MGTHWSIFQARLLDPILEGKPPPSFKQVSTQHGVADETQASNMFKTVKRRFQEALKKQVRQTVSSGEVVEDEVREIFRIATQ